MAPFPTIERIKGRGPTKKGSCEEGDRRAENGKVWGRTSTAIKKENER